MKIAIDLRTVTFGEAGGLTRWLTGALGHLIRADRDNQYLVFGMPYNYHLLDFHAPNLTRITLSAADYLKKTQDRLDFEGDVAVLFRCFPYERELSFPAHRQVVCLPDLRHERFPDDQPPDVRLERRRLFHYYQNMAGAVGTFSEFSRRELLACPWTTCQDVFLMPPALPEVCAEPESRQAADEAEAIAPDAPYLLYPANLWPHKNHDALIDAFARFHRAAPDFHLVLTGYRDAWPVFADKVKDLPVSHLGYVSPRVLAALYRRARAVVHPSKYETFGLPLLEAFAAGVPVLCSRDTALAEVGGDAVLGCDPSSIDDLAEGMSRIVNDKTLRSTLVERGRERLGLYSWEATAQALKGAFQRVAARADSRQWYCIPKPLVSVVTPSYNQGKFIRQTIESVLGQDYPHLDFRVVDGGSTDETLDVLRGYGDRFPWLSEKDRGQTHAINKGLALAKGQILSYLNSDDILRPGAISRVVMHFLKRPACDLVYGRDAYMDAEGNYLGWFPTRPYSFEALIDNCCVSQPAAFWRDRIMNAAGLFDESLFSVMDYEYWMRLDRAGAIVEYVPELFASTRIHSEAKTSGGNDYQTRRFREMFVSSYKHAGHLSRDNLMGWIKHWLYPRYPALEWVPETTAQAVEAWFTYRHVYGCGKPGALARTAERAIAAFFGLPKISPVSYVRDKFRKRQVDNKSRIPYQRWGPWLHNMLGPKVVVPAAVDRGDDDLKLSGRPLCDTTLSVKLGDVEVARLPLKAREVADVKVRCRAVKGDRRMITLEFSHWARCPVRGEYAFELLGTNLFGERFLG